MVPQGLKLLSHFAICGTAEAVPLSEADRACARWPTHAMRLREWGTRSQEGSWRQKQIPFGDDNKKCDGKGEKGNCKGKNKCNGKSSRRSFDCGAQSTRAFAQDDSFFVLRASSPRVLRGSSLGVLGDEMDSAEDTGGDG
jgi:hypothetical protein